MYLRHLIRRASLALAASLWVAASASAQNTPIRPGDWTIGRIDATTPAANFSLEVPAGTPLQVRALSLNSSLDLALSLVGADGTSIFVPAVWATSVRDAAFDTVLNLDTPYVLTTLLGTGGNPLAVPSGEFLLQVIEPALPADIPLLTGTEEVVDATPEAPAYRRLSASADCPLVVSLANATETGAPFAARISGSIRAQEYYGGLETRFIIPAGASAETIVEIKPLYAVFPARVRISAGCAAEIPSQAEALATLPPPLFAPTFAPPAGQLMILVTGGSIEYGQGFVGTVAEGMPLTTYSFAGRAGDVITGEAIGLSPDMRLGIAILSPQTAPIRYSAGVPFGFTPAEAAVSAVLPEDGTYSLLVSSQGAGGAYLLRLNGGAPFVNDALTLDQPFSVTADALFAAGSEPLRLSATAPESCLSVFSAAPDLPFSGYVVLRDPSGELVLGARMSDSSGASAVLPASGEAYTVEVQADNTSQEISLTLTLSCIEDSAA